MTGFATKSISATNGSVVVVPLTYAETCDGGVQADASSIVIIWDDDSDSIESIGDAIKQALDNQANRSAIPVWTPPPQDQVTGQ